MSQNGLAGLKSLPSVCGTGILRTAQSFTNSSMCLMGRQKNRQIYKHSKNVLTWVMHMEIAITKMSSKGQVVIPAEMREGINEGDKLIVIQNKDQIILKKANKMDKKFKEDLEFARRTEEAWKRYEKGEFIEMDFDEFLEKTKKW